MASRTLSLITDLQRPECLCKLSSKLSCIGWHLYGPARDVAFVSDVYSMLRETPVRRRCCVVAATFLLKCGIPEVLVATIITEAFLIDTVHSMSCSSIVYHKAFLITDVFAFYDYSPYVPYLDIPETQTEISGHSIEEMIRVQGVLDHRDTRRRRDQLRRLRRLRQSHWK